MKIKTNLIVLCVLVLAIVALLVLLQPKATENVVDNVKQDKMYGDAWLSENCKCLARDKFACRWPGFEYQNGLCFNNETKTKTSPIAKCSEYDCEGEIVHWDKTLLDWLNMN